nr:hypothetical protein [Tanacetum cinerariifolium]
MKLKKITCDLTHHIDFKCCELCHRNNEPDCLVSEGQIEEISDENVDNSQLPISDKEQEFKDTDTDDDSNEDVDD